MTKIKDINIAPFDYDLPDDRIAKFPLKHRDQSKLLIYKNDEIIQDKFNSIINHIPKNSHLIFNNTHVIQSRLFFQKPTGAIIEIFCLEPHFPSDYTAIFSQTVKCQWKCIVGNLKKWKESNLKKKIQLKNESTNLIAKKVSHDFNNLIIEFEWDNNNISFGDILENSGVTPIPPYLKRESEKSDKERYQTIYGKFDGSVAAPTAGLHFTEKIISDLGNSGFKLSEITLHVGAGTFKPVKTQTIGEHSMHTEHYSVGLKLIENILSNKNIIATGTTTLRTLESLYWAGVKCLYGLSPLHIQQWDPYKLNGNISLDKSLTALKQFILQNDIDSLIASTQLIIVPGYNFKVVKGLITNYHQPRSTLLLLVAAFVGEKWKDIYNYALENDFRFLSYGDSSILLPDYHL